LKVANAIIAVAWRTGLEPQSNLSAYRICSSGINSTNWENVFANLIPKYLREYPVVVKPFWYPTTTLYTNHTLYKIHSFIAHRLPAQIVDLYSSIIGKNTNYLNSSDIIKKGMSDFRHFLISPFNFPSKNVPKLLNSMSDKDRQEFPFDVRTINWNEYIKTYVQGIRTFLFKQDASTLEESRRNIARYN
jgi:alcohol-forming fatty acyl-CoA reductase